MQHNRRIHTHLRGLLWGGAGSIFVVFLLFGRHIANNHLGLAQRIVIYE